MTLQQLLVEGTSILEKAGVPDAALDARYFLMDAFRLDAASFLLKRSQEIGMDGRTGDAVSRYRDGVAKRSTRIPLQYILGVQEFMGLEFKVDERVLIPRQDTEDLVERILKEHPETTTRILDMCTGSGCIAVSLARLGGYERVTAVDISDGALDVAAENAERLHVSGQMRCVKSSMFEREADILGLNGEKYHILVSNPPYIPTEVIDGLQPEVREYEPKLALDGSGDGLHFYRLLASESGRFLVPGGSIYLEIGHDQGEAVSGLLRAAGYVDIEVIKDTPGLDRIIKARYIGKSPSHMFGGKRIGGFHV